MTQEETYNGWKNYPTWAVNLWLGNDQGIYEETARRVQESVHSARWANLDALDETPPRYAVGEMLREWVTNDLAPDLGASFASDLLGYALDCVDWYDIADQWIEACKESETMSEP